MLQRLIIWVRTLYYFIFSIKCVSKAKFLNANETTCQLSKSNKSLIRFGDGEFNIISGKGIHYQSFSKELSEELKYIIEAYIKSNNSSAYLLALPSDFFMCSGLKLLKKRVYVSSWSFSRWLFKNYYDKQVQYGDAFLFAKDYENIYKELWINADVVIFVHNNKRYADYFLGKYGIETKFVGIPNKNAYEKKNSILKEIYNQISSCDSDSKIVTLISAGPTGKVLVKELSDDGYLAYDTGHCWDEPLKLIEE